MGMSVLEAAVKVLGMVADRDENDALLVSDEPLVETQALAAKYIQYRLQADMEAAGIATVGPIVDLSKVVPNDL